MTDEVERIKLAGQIDISCVQAFHTLKEIDEMIEIAKKYGFAAVFTLPAFSAHVAERLRDCREIHTGGVVSFPGGGDTIEQKKRQAKELWETGCEEVDMVINLGDAKQGDFHAITEEIKALKSVCGDNILKVIIEACFLTNEEKIELCHCVTEGGADFIKTSTGFGSGGATLEDVKLFKKHIGPNVQIKAAGGIRSISDMKAYIAEGCSRIGASAAVELLKDHLDEEV